MIVIVFVILFCFSAVLNAQELPALNQIDEKIPVKTLGGILFWGDVLFDNEWHIQENVTNHSFRLLDKNSVQRAYGTFEECRRRLEEIRSAEGVLPMSGTAVIILHGFGSNVSNLKKLADRLREKKTHDYVFCMAYPSTMQSIFEHSKMLRRVVGNLPPTVKRIDFIGHSLGSIVIRRYLSGPLDKDWQVPENEAEYRKEFCPDSRVGCFVMLGPPNHGAELAKVMIGKKPVRRFFAGKSGDELGIDWEKTEKTLGIPCCPFIIIAGGKGSEKGYSALIPGDDDGIVSTEGTKLNNAERWVQVTVKHNDLLQSQTVFEIIDEFFKKPVTTGEVQFTAHKFFVMP